MSKEIDWETAQHISDRAVVHDAIFNFSQDSTEDAAVIMVMEIIKSWERYNGRS
jgi:hypothetical protein